MSGSRLPDGSMGSMPRKVAELVRADENVHVSLARVSSLVRARGLSARVLERIIVASPTGADTTLRVMAQGLCGEPGKSYDSLAQALAAENLVPLWRAALIAGYIEFVQAAVERTGLNSTRLWGTSWAMAEMSHWVAERHVVDPDDAFVWGLLLDVGLVAMAYALPEVYAAYANSPDSRPAELFELESFGFDHATVGQDLLRVYKFSDTAIDLTASHHHPLRSLSMEGKVLRAAMVAVGAAGGDSGLGKPASPLDKAVLEGALLKPDQAEAVTATAKGYLLAALRFKPTLGSQAA